MNEEVEALCTTVFARQVAPVADVLAGIEHLIVVASGSMLGIPIDVLVDQQGRTALDLVPVSYAPSASLLRWLRERTPRATNAGRALLVGDPPFTADHLRDMEAALENTASGDRGRGVGYLRRLPYTRGEVRSVAATFDQTMILLGAEASEAAIDSLAQTNRLVDFGTLHLATHAITDPRRPENASLVLAQTGLIEPGEALARNERVYDGVITAREIMATWQLDADLVTLSACNTGLGRRVHGEGYVGLAHASVSSRQPQRAHESMGGGRRSHRAAHGPLLSQPGGWAGQGACVDARQAMATRQPRAVPPPALLGSVRPHGRRSVTGLGQEDSLRR